MAAPVQTVKCEQKNPEQQIPSGNSGLKNGTSMEEANTDEVPGNTPVTRKAKSPNQGREVTMENFQDGGPQHQDNMSTEQSGPYSNMDGPRLNSDMNNYSRDSGDRNAATDDYGKMNDSLNQGQMQAYGGGYNNRANYMADQHGGGAPLSANSTDNSSNSQYGQYNHQNVRPGYLQPSKAMSMGPPPRPTNSAMMLGYNNSPTQHQQRFLSGHSISQQGGPTPTLNQLLQSPNSVQRYHNSYGDYNMGQSLNKGPSDMINTSQYPHNWNSNAASRGLNTPYTHQMASSAYRNQSGPMDHNHQGTMKRPSQGPYMHPSYSFQGQYGSQYSQRYAPVSQVRPSPMGMAGQNYPQQYNQQQNPQQSSMSGFERQGFMPQMSQNFQQQHHHQQQQPPPSQQQSQGNRPQSSTLTPSKEGHNETLGVSLSSDDMSGEGNQSTANPGTPTPPASHSSMINMRPTSSLSSSTGSRSLSPAISSQQNIPVPPRPSSQSESGQNRMSHSPVAPQGGYNQPMAPPHLTPSMYGNKGHPGMMGGSQQMASYSPQNQAYSQGSYPRNHQGSMGMQGYGNQSQTYPGSQPNSMSQQLYGMNRIGNHMPAAQGYGGGGNSTSVEPVAIQDEASQQSTASNTSNTDEQAETLRPRKDVIVQSHPPTPASTLPSPGAVSMSSFHDEFENASSPSWPRTPASPVVNSQIHEYHPPPFSKRPDSLNKLYDISDDPERRSFLDRLMQFNDERGSALTQCPTISKQPLDLFKLYLVLKDRGGFVEVTKSKQWKDVAGQIGIGASSSAAYTLRKQYVKHLLPYECKFDRGGIDPQPIISQLEVATRKKNSSKTNTAPSPAGSSNSQDSFTASNSQSMDGFPTPPAPPPFSQYSQSGSVPNSDYPVGSIMGPIPPSSMPNSDPSPHPNMMHPPPHNSDSINVQNPFADDMQAHPYPRGSNMNSAMPPPSLQNYGYGSGGSMQQRAAPNIPPVSIPPAYAGNQPMPGQNPPAPTYSYNEQINRGMPMAPQSDQFPPTDQYRRGQQQMMNHDGAYNNRMPESYGAAGPNYSPARMPGTALQFPCGPQFDRESGQAMPAREPVYPPRSYSGSPAAQHGAPADQYRQEQSYPMPSPNQATDSPQAQLTPGSPKKSQCYPSGQQGLYSPSSKMMPPQGYAQGPKRHPDFMKPNDQQFPSSNSFSSVLTPQLPLPFSGWRNDNQFAGYGSQVAPPPPAMPRDDWSGRDQSGQWSAMHQRYSSPGSSSYGSGGTMPSHINPNMSAQNSMGSSVSLRQVMMQRMPLSSFKDKQPTQYTMQTKIQPASQITATNAQYPPKRDIIFPIDSVEAITPLLVKRKKIMARDLIPVEAWRLMMSLKSGLICESTWALDMLSVLLFDDSSVLYFSLQNLPGLLEVLMEHYRRCLSEVFGMNEEIEPSFMTFKDQKLPTLDTTTTTRRHWWQCRDKVKPGANDSNEGSDVDLGVVDCVDPSDKTVVTDCYFNNGKTIHGKVVKVLSKKDLFVSDADKVWDTFEGFSRSSEHWQLGGGDTTLHIQTRFENDKHLVQFVNVLKDVKNSKSDVEESKLWSHATKDCVNSKCDTSKRTQRGESTDLIVDRCIHKDLASDDEATKKNIVTIKTEMKEEPQPSNDTRGGEMQKPVFAAVTTTAAAARAAAAAAVTKSAAAAAVTTSAAPSVTTSAAPAVTTSAAPSVTTSAAPAVTTSAAPATTATATATAALKKDVIIPASALMVRGKKRQLDDYEDEAYNRDEPSLVLLKDCQDSVLRRCICISNILRSLSFVPGNDAELSKHPGFLLIMGKLLLLHHNHALKRQNQCNYDKEEDVDFSDSCSSLYDHEWWWDGLHVLRENTLVSLSNIAGQLDLSLYPEEISLPILDGLLHWSVCTAAYAQDPLPTLPAHSVLSPQRLTLEALCKLSVQDSNVDLILATPPFSRIERLFGFLSRSMSKQEDLVVREFSVVLLHYFAQADLVAARVIACQSTSISLLISFVEQAEQSALTIANAHGINVLRESPEMMGTSLDMLRRAANTLLALARVSENRLLFLQHQQRILNLVMSQILDQHVAAILADVLYECSQPDEVVS